MERYVAALAFHAARLEDRIGRVERRAAGQEEAYLDLPSHGDLLDVRLHSARVSAGLGRLALELRAEVAEIKDEADRAAKAASRAARAAELAQDPERLVELAEQLFEMADALDARRRLLAARSGRRAGVHRSAPVRRSQSPEVSHVGTSESARARPAVLARGPKPTVRTADDSA